MKDSWSRDSGGRPEAPLYWLAALGILGGFLGRPADPHDPHFWARTIVGIIINAAVVAVCVYVLIDLVQYQLSTSPCQQMGTC